MNELVIEYFSIYFLSMLKFIAGPMTGLIMGTSVWETSIFTTLGMMTSVVLFSFIGKIFREKVINRFFKKKKVFSRKNRRFVTLWQKYGIMGISFLTPVLFSPIGGTMLITSLAGLHQKKKLFTCMLLSASFWSFTLSSLAHLVPL